MVASKRFLTMAILAGCFFLSSLPAAAQDSYPPPIAPESAKLQILEKILRDERTQLFLLSPPEHSEEQRNWCRQFLADFKAGGAVTIVEPVARSERYGDPAFSPWQRSCPTLAMNAKQRLSYLSLIGDYAQLPRHMSDGRLLDGYEYGTRNFKLYVADIDNEPSNGDEAVFYSERAYSYWEAILKAPGFELALPPVDTNWNDILPPEKVPEMTNYWGSNYKAFRPSICLASDLLGPSDPYDYGAGMPVPSLNGILAYKGKNYLLTWQPEQQELWEFKLLEAEYIGVGARSDIELRCAFR